MTNQDTIRSIIDSNKMYLEDIKAAVDAGADPVTLGILVAALIEERKKTNAILEEIRREIRRLGVKGSEEVVDLSEADERIVEMIRKVGAVTAEDVKEALGYKGLNGASARLNALYKRGILRKVRKGKKVYFTLA